MTQKYLSDTELYFAQPGNKTVDKIMLLDEEVHHITKVMRHNEGDKIYITTGEGKIWLCEIAGIEKKKALCLIEETLEYKNDFTGFTFCLPVMKSNDRLEFALEKLVELGITNFIIYSPGKGSSRAPRLDRLEKIAIAAMKQSLRAFRPEINIFNSLEELFNTKGEKIVFDQKSDKTFSEYVKNSMEKNSGYYLIIGPEAGFSENEYKLFTNVTKLKLTDNRLRTETAAVVVGTVIATIF